MTGVTLHSLPVFFRPEMLAHVASMSPSASKPADVMRSWSKLGVPLEMREPSPVTQEMLFRAHEASYVNDVLSCRADNGFGTRASDVAQSLPYTSGAMLAAALEAIRNRAVAGAPCSGFHHAGYAHGSGFCTFNGLMIAALELKFSRLVERVGILDFDQHWGDGTHDIIEQTASEGWIEHYSPQEYGSARVADDFLREIPAIVSRFQDCGVILYQAGADPHIDDPLGGWLTTEQLENRDARVFEVARQIGVPIAWNLAGGYQTPLRKVLDIHDNTLRACWRAYGTVTG